MKERRPRILVIGALPPPYIGPSIATADILASKPIREEFQIIFCDISDRRELVSLGKFDWPNVLLAFMHIPKCLAMILVRQPDIVYFGISQGFWGYLRDLGFFIPGVLLRKKIVVHLRGSEFDTLYAQMPSMLRQITRFLFRKVACVIVLSDRLRCVFSGLVSEERITVVPNGIDCTPFGPKEEISAKKTDGKRLLWLSNLFVRKGIIQFIESLPAVFSAHPDATATLAGEWESPELRKRSLDFIEAHCFSSKITFAGRVNREEKLRLFKTHDVFVLPPIQPEGMPWSILEAMSAGLAVVCSAQGAIPDLVRDGQTGFLVEPTPTKIAACLNRLLSHPELAKEIGVRARIHIEENFSKSIYLSKLTRVFAFAMAC
jgi:glycosyltransferase involved in cell wall biosynthesis